MAKDSWACGKDGPTTVPDLRKALTALVKKRKGDKLISKKFTRDHIFAGHAGKVEKLAAMLADVRSLSKSTLMISSMASTAQKEVLNWIDNVPANKLTYSNGTWSVSRSNSAVEAANAYSFATVDLDALKAMNRDDIVKKSRKWLKQSQKRPKVACMFAKDGTPVIYHLDY